MIFRLIKRTVMTITLIVLAFYTLVSWYFSSLILIAARSQEDLSIIRSAQSSLNVTIERIAFESKFGEAFDAWHLTRKNHAPCVIVFTHGWGSSRLGMESFQRAFSDTACNFVLYDLRGHGAHPAFYSSGGIYEQEELLQISRYLVSDRRFDNDQIGWFGVSLGASTALQAAAHDFKPGFIVADSAFQAWDTAIFERGVKMYGTWVYAFRPGVRAAIALRGGFDYQKANVLKSAELVQSPTLIIHSASDIDTHPSQSEAIYAELDPNNSELFISDWGAGHANDVEQRPEEYRALINQFLSKYAPQFGTPR